MVRRPPEILIEPFQKTDNLQNEGNNSAAKMVPVKINTDENHLYDKIDFMGNRVLMEDL